MGTPIMGIQKLGAKSFRKISYFRPPVSKFHYSQEHHQKWQILNGTERELDLCCKIMLGGKKTFVLFQSRNFRFFGWQRFPQFPGGNIGIRTVIPNRIIFDCMSNRSLPDDTEYKYVSYIGLLVINYYSIPAIFRQKLILYLLIDIEVNLA